MRKSYQFYIRVKYQFWKLYWKVRRTKRPKIWHELMFDLTNRKGIAVGKIYPYGNPVTGEGCSTKVIFNSKDFGIVAYKSKAE